VLVAAGQPAQAQRELITRANVVLAASATMLLLVDRGQTEYALRDGRGEWNPIIGPHPSVGRLNTYIAITGLGQLAIGLALNAAGARNFWWGTIAMLEALAVTNSAVSLKIPIRL
jgi:hypothetical protein